MKDIILTGQQVEQFRQALVAAFHTPALLKQMVHFQLSKRLDTFVPNGSLNDMAYNLILNAESSGWLYNLLVAARSHNSGNDLLRSFEQSISLSTRDIPKHELEAKIRVLDQFISLADWLPKLYEIERQVCRVETPNSFGTGFLVGSNIVVTNYHVLKNLINGKDVSNEVKLRFDYKKLRPQSEDLGGVTFELASDWLIGHSPMSEFDHPLKQGLPSESELDYVLIRIKNHLNQGAIQLPNISLENFYKNYEHKKPVFIVQHPKGEPIKLAVDVESVIGLNQNETRLSYKTLTAPGSSGSPCFNQNLELIALHHNGIEGSQNLGIPIHTLIKDWQQKRFLSLQNEWLV